MLALRFLTELKRWKLAGSPKRTDAEVQSLYFDTCKPCENFQPDSARKECGQCAICECHLAPDNRTINKLRWATTACPLDPPRFVADVNAPAHQPAPCGGCNQPKAAP